VKRVPEGSGVFGIEKLYGKIGPAIVIEIIQERGG